MPILTVEIVARLEEEWDADFAQQLAHRAGEIFASSAGGTWVKVHFIPHEQYAENSQEPVALHPVFVSILKANLPDKDGMAKEVRQLTTAVAQLCQRPPENVHIIYLPAGNGRVAFGGRIVSS
jgi:phenylpyruvate tautomerase PptA (4-oxalocrotonate tautomerase family)